MSVSEVDVALIDEFPMRTMTRAAEPVRTDFERREPRCQARGRRVMATGEHDKRLRAELAAELGWYPADLDDDSIARHRADAARKKTDRDPAKRWAHLTERARQRDVEARGRAEVADLYE